MCRDGESCHCTFPKGAVSLQEEASETVPFWATGTCSVSTRSTGHGEEVSQARTSSRSAQTPVHVTVTVTVRIIVAVLSVRYRLALAPPS